MEPIQNNRSAAVTAAETTSERIDQIRLGAGSSPEEMLALASLDVEEAADRSRQTRRLDREASGLLQRGAIGKKRKAARLQLAAQIVSAVGTIASSATNVLGGEGAKPWAEAGGAHHDAVSAALSYRASEVTEDANMLELHGQEAQQRSSDSGEHADALDQHQGKLMQATESISRLRHDAMMASIRG